MSKTIGIQLTIYGLVLAGLSYPTWFLAPATSLITLITGMAGGLVFFTLGLRATAGKTGRGLPLVLLIPIGFVMLSRAVLTWQSHAPAPLFAAWVFTAALFVLSVALAMRLAYAQDPAQTKEPPAGTGAESQLKRTTTGPDSRAPVGPRTMHP